MKTLLLVLILIGLSFSSAAQETPSCSDSAVEASTLIIAAQALLAEGNSVEASTVLDSATLLLQNCNTVAPVEAVVTPAPSATLAPPSDAVDPIATGSYTITAPTLIEENSIAFVRFAHTSVDMGAIDIYMGNSNVLVVSNLVYGEFTEFVPINGGQLSIVIRSHDAGADSDVLSQISWDFVGNSSWIVSALGVAEKLAFNVETISITRNDYAEQARLRIVNVMADAPRVTVNTDSGEVLADGLSWIGIQDTMLAPGTYNLQFSSENSSEPLAQSFDFEANVTYTLYVIGRGTPELPLQVLNIASPADMAYVQFTNNSGAAIDIHYRPGNVLFVENLPTGVESAWMGLPSDSYTFISFAPGTGPTGQELAGIAIQLRPNRYMVFDVTGSEMRLVSESLSEGE